MSSVSKKEPSRSPLATLVTDYTALLRAPWILVLTPPPPSRQSLQSFHRTSPLSPSLAHLSPSFAHPSRTLSPLKIPPPLHASSAWSRGSEMTSNATTNAIMRDGDATVALTVAKSAITSFPSTSTSATNATFVLASVVAATDCKGSWGCLHTDAKFVWLFGFDSQLPG